jgi:thimet oligopeptidase
METKTALLTSRPDSGSEVIDHTATEMPDWTAVYPYDRIEPEHITAIVEATIARCDALSAQIANSSKHTFDTMLATRHEILDAIWLAGGYIAQWLVNPDATVRAVAQKAEIELTHYCIDLSYDETTYRQFKKYRDSYEGQNLPSIKKRVRDMADNTFHHCGHELSQPKKERLQELDHDLAECEVAFDYNLLNDATTVELSETEVAGLSSIFKKTLQKNPKTGSYAVTMDYPSYYPFMRQAESRGARRKVAKAFFSRAKDNARLLDDIVDIRQEMAKLLGRKSWAHAALHESMAESVGKIFHFYDELIDPLTAKAEKEVAVMTDMLRRDGHRGPLRDFDIDYYENEVVKEQYGIDHEEVSGYFPLDVVMGGLFKMTGELFNIRYRRARAATWHPDVTAYTVAEADSGDTLGLFYLDLFPREGKYKHACAMSLIPGRQMPDASYRLPVAAIIANCTPPTANKPSLLSQSERAEHLFHEFGHVLHSCLTTAEYVTMSGFSTETDMAEVPSQVMEFWGWEPELMVRYSRHYRTGDHMPLEMATRLAESKNVNVALRTLERIRKGMFDLAVHLNDDPSTTVRQIWGDVSQEVGIIPPQRGTYFPATFGHIAASGYAANYHCYERAMPPCADIFERFKQRGLTDPQLGMKYRRKILEPGYSQQGIDTIKSFLGKVDEQPYLRNLGITAIAHS